MGVLLIVVPASKPCRSQINDKNRLHFSETFASIVNIRPKEMALFERFSSKAYVLVVLSSSPVGAAIIGP